jgi:regulator of cell morphogenesis and NO signaling
MMGGFDPEHAWLAGTTPEVIRFLEDMHQDQWRLTVAPASERLAEALRAYGDVSPGLFDVGRHFDHLKRELVEHRAREEATIVPALASPDIAAEDVEAHLAEIRAAHVRIAAILDQIRGLTFRYSTAPDAEEAPEIEHLYAALREVDGDVRRHMHIEEDRLVEMVPQPTDDT